LRIRESFEGPAGPASFIHILLFWDRSEDAAVDLMIIYL
jgi:hypothetical protein